MALGNHADVLQTLEREALNLVQESQQMLPAVVIRLAEKRPALRLQDERRTAIDLGDEADGGLDFFDRRRRVDDDFDERATADEPFQELTMRIPVDLTGRVREFDVHRDDVDEGSHL
jgi:hypothetical protein